MRRAFVNWLNWLVVARVLVLSIGLTVVCVNAFAQERVHAAAGKEASQFEVGSSNGLLTVTAKNADVRILLNAIAAKSGIEIVLDKTIAGKATLGFKDMKFEDGLRQILEVSDGGGFLTEYVRKNGSQTNVDIQKVVIARQAALPQSVQNIGEENIFRIEEMYVGEVKGEEVLFVPWGDGKGQIPFLVTVVDGEQEVAGFDRFRIGEDGTLYFVGWGHKKLWVYSNQLKQLSAINLTLGKFGGDTFDVDHEGNIYVLTYQGRKNDALIDEIRVYGRNLQEVARISASAGKAGGGDCAVVVNGLLVNVCEDSRIVADFRHLLKNPNSHSRKLKDFFYATRGSMIVANPLGSAMEGIGILLINNVRKLGLTKDVIAAPFPEEWAHASEGWRPLGYHATTYYGLMGIPAERQFGDDYAFATLNIAEKHATYLRIPEKDTLIYQKRALASNFVHFDVDLEGNAYQLFTGKDGVHIYKYGLETKR